MKYSHEVCQKCLMLPVCRNKIGSIQCDLLANTKVNFDKLSELMGRHINSISYDSELRRLHDRDKEREEKAFGAYMRKHGC